ncbi:MAG TPA: sigma-70 family RNA polymerase sigma factor [Chthoniobacterales bacterium]
MVEEGARAVGTSRDVTEILSDWHGGDGEAAAELIPLVYEELRRRARDYLRRERPDHTLQATALVHEAYLRMLDDGKVTSRSRAQFFGIAARVMRRVLVDHARAHQTQKRGGGAHKFSLDEARALACESTADLLALNSVLDQLAKIYPRKSRVVELKFFGGMETREISELLAVSEKTVLRDWNFAKLWLCRALSTEAA